MTKEDAIKIFNTVLLFSKCDCPKEEIEECLKMAIKALEQETCEDCISRKELLKEITEIDYGSNMDIYTNEVREIVNELPSIQPKANNVIDDIRAKIIENSIEDYEYHGCGTNELIIETSEVLKIIDKYKVRK